MGRIGALVDIPSVIARARDVARERVARSGCEVGIEGVIRHRVARVSLLEGLAHGKRRIGGETGLVNVEHGELGARVIAARALDEHHRGTRCLVVCIGHGVVGAFGKRSSRRARHGDALRERASRVFRVAHGSQRAHGALGQVAGRNGKPKLHRSGPVADAHDGRRAVRALHVIENHVVGAVFERGARARCHRDGGCDIASRVGNGRPGHHDVRLRRIRDIECNGRSAAKHRESAVDASAVEGKGPAEHVDEQLRVLHRLLAKAGRLAGHDARMRVFGNRGRVAYGRAGRFGAVIDVIHVERAARGSARFPGEPQAAHNRASSIPALIGDLTRVVGVGDGHRERGVGRAEKPHKAAANGNVVLRAADGAHVIAVEHGKRHARAAHEAARRVLGAYGAAVRALRKRERGRARVLVVANESAGARAAAAYSAGVHALGKRERQIIALAGIPRAELADKPACRIAAGSDLAGVRATGEAVICRAGEGLPDKAGCHREAVSLDGAVVGAVGEGSLQGAPRRQDKKARRAGRVVSRRGAHRGVVRAVLEADVAERVAHEAGRRSRRAHDGALDRKVFYGKRARLRGLIDKAGEIVHVQAQRNGMTRAIERAAKASMPSKLVDGGHIVCSRHVDVVGKAVVSISPLRGLAVELVCEELQIRAVVDEIDRAELCIVFARKLRRGGADLEGRALGAANGRVVRGNRHRGRALGGVIGILYVVLGRIELLARRDAHRNRRLNGRVAVYPLRGNRIDGRIVEPGVDDIERRGRAVGEFLYGAKGARRHVRRANVRVVRIRKRVVGAFVQGNHVVAIKIGEPRLRRERAAGVNLVIY